MIRVVSKRLGENMIEKLKKTKTVYTSAYAREKAEGKIRLSVLMGTQEAHNFKMFAARQGLDVGPMIRLLMLRAMQTDKL